MINMTRGNPAPESFPIEEMIEASARNLRKDGKVVLQYLHSPGFLPLRDLLAEMNGVAPEQVFMGNSSLELFGFLTQLLLKPGMRAFVESPTYDRANTLLRRIGAEVVAIPMETDGVDLDAFERELKRGLPGLFYIVADFQNPMGTTTSLAKRQQIAAWAREYGFWITEDTPYRLLRYHGEPIPTMRSMAPDKVIELSSFSKVLAPGLRSGYLIGSKQLVSDLHDWAVDTYIGPVTPTQGMVYEYLHAGLLDANLARIRDLYRPRLDAVLSCLAQYLPDAVYPKPEGGFFVGVTLPKGNRMEDLIPRTLEAGLKITDGRGFYVNPSDGDRFLRIPFCSLTPEEIEESLQKVSKIIVH
jgi:2-aminoadipate transaminase